MPDEPKGRNSGCCELIIKMKDSEHQSLERMRAFLEGIEEVGFKAESRREAYEWTQATLCAQE